MGLLRQFHTLTLKLHAKIWLTRVLYVLDVKYNLISVHRLAIDSGLDVIFNSTQCVVQDQLNKEVIAIGIVMNESCFTKGLVSKDTKGEQCMLTTSGDIQSTSNPWHERQGHPSHNVLNKVSVDEVVVDDKVCDVRHNAKKKKKIMYLLV